MSNKPTLHLQHPDLRMRPADEPTDTKSTDPLEHHDLRIAPAKEAKPKEK